MMHLVGDYYLNTEGYGVTLSVATGTDKKTGETIYRPIGYYSNIEQAVNACVEKKISIRIADGMHTLEEGLAIIREEKRQMKELLEKAMNGDW